MLRMLLCAAVLLVPLVEKGEGQSSLGRSASDIADIIGMVSQDSLRVSIAGLQSFGSRLSTNANRKSVAQWVQRRMEQAGVTDVVLDSFQIGGTWQYNVVGTIGGAMGAEREIILGAHTDSYSGTPGQAPGADDNASGTAAVLEIARVLHQTAYSPHATFRFIGFAAEEAGLLGSGNYAGRAATAGRRVSAMLNFDMIGHRNASSSLRDFSVVWYTGAEWLAELDSLMARTYTTLTPVLTTSVRSGSDSYAFWYNGFPAVFHYERGSNLTYHTASDILDSLDLSYAAEITQAGLATALSVDAGITLVQPPGVLPEQLTLFQNYPNPFNSTTLITYEVPESRLVTLAVYDILGREVATLVDGWKDRGSYTVRFDGGGVTSGVYLYRLNAGGHGMTRKMQLLK